MVYFITDGEYIKIGTANNPKTRLKELQTGNARPLSIIKSIKGSFAIENAFHYKYKEYRVSGEWFNLPKEIIGEITNKDFELKTFKAPDVQVGVESNNIIGYAFISYILKNVWHKQKVTPQKISKRLSIPIDDVKAMLESFDLDKKIKSFNHANKIVKDIKNKQHLEKIALKEKMRQVEGELVEQKELANKFKSVEVYEDKETNEECVKINGKVYRKRKKQYGNKKRKPSHSWRVRS